MLIYTNEMIMHTTIHAIIKTFYMLIILHCMQNLHLQGGPFHNFILTFNFSRLLQFRNSLFNEFHINDAVYANDFSHNL